MGDEAELFQTGHSGKASSSRDLNTVAELAMPRSRGKTLPGKKTCAKCTGRTVLKVFKEHKEARWLSYKKQKREELRQRNSVQIMYGTVGGCQGNSERDASGSAQEGRSGSGEKGVYF